MNKKITFVIILPILFVMGILVCVISPLRLFIPNAKTPQGSLLGNLRGNTVIIIKIVPKAGRVEDVYVSQYQSATRSFRDERPLIHFGRASIPPTVWMSIETLRRSWCTNPPVFRKPNVGDSFYEVAIKCSGNNDRLLQMPFDQMPTELAQFLNTVPPASTPAP